MTKLEQIESTTSFLKTKGVKEGAIGIILGTGLTDLIKQIEIEIEIPYDVIPHFPKSTMEYHNAKLCYGQLNKVPVLVFDGRFHAYEGLSYFEITYPVRIMHRLGVQNMIVSNAAGSINLDFNKGEVMLIEDHINLQPGSPLAEKGIEKLGQRFVDMSQPYCEKMKEMVKQIAREKNILLHKGVYVSVLGPQLETKAEYRYLKTIGADAVGMSTVPEIIVANQLQLPCIAFSVLTDNCDPDNLHPIDLEDIFANAKKAEQNLIVLVKDLIQTLFKK